MSKILKTIVNLVVLFSIVIAAALLVPPFAGVDTVMNDNGSTDTNIPVGSVAYGKDVRVKDLKKKDKIIFSEGSSTYVYEITDMDSSAGAYEVKDPYSKSSDTEVITLQKSVPRVAVVVPFIGYAAIALQTKGGLIVIGLGIILLIILFILSELWRKDEDEDEEEAEEEYEEDDDDEDDEEEETLSRKERRRLKKEEKRRLKEEEEDEEYEEDDEEESFRTVHRNVPALRDAGRLWPHRFQLDDHGRFRRWRQGYPDRCYPRVPHLHGPHGAGLHRDLSCHHPDV